MEYRIEAEEVRGRRVDAAEPDARDAPGAALRAVGKDFGRRLAQLTGAAARKAPDPDAVETFMRDSFQTSAAAACKAILEQHDAALPAPDCPSCGRPMSAGGPKRSPLPVCSAIRIFYPFEINALRTTMLRMGRLRPSHTASL